MAPKLKAGAAVLLSVFSSDFAPKLKAEAGLSLSAGFAPKLKLEAGFSLSVGLAPKLNEEAGLSVSAGLAPKLKEEAGLLSVSAGLAPKLKAGVAGLLSFSAEPEAALAPKLKVEAGFAAEPKADVVEEAAGAAVEFPNEKAGFASAGFASLELFSAGLAPNNPPDVRLAALFEDAAPKEKAGFASVEAAGFEPNKPEPD